MSRRESAKRTSYFAAELSLIALSCRGAMGIAGRPWSVKPRPFCIFLASAEAFLSRPFRRTFWPDGGLGSQKKPFP